MQKKEIPISSKDVKLTDEMVEAVRRDQTLFSPTVRLIAHNQVGEVLSNEIPPSAEAIMAMRGLREELLSRLDNPVE